MSSAICCKLDLSKILSSGNWLSRTFLWCLTPFKIPALGGESSGMESCKVGITFADMPSLNSDASEKKYLVARTEVFINTCLRKPKNTCLGALTA